MSTAPGFDIKKQLEESIVGGGHMDGHGELPQGEPAPVPTMGHEAHLGQPGEPTPEQQAQHHQQLQAALAAAQHEHAAIDITGAGLADQAALAALAAAMGSTGGLGLGLLGPTPMTAHLLGQTAEGLGGEPASAGGAPRPPQSIPRGQEGYSRKAKSLSLLCENFVAQFGQVVNQVINLDNAASQLGVERRRIYDIVNVLESIKVVSKLQKNQYQWHGTAKLVDTLTELHDEAQREMDELMQAKSMTGEDLTSLGLDDRKEKSMSRLSQRFVQMFMLSKNRSLGLDEAARALLGGNEDQGQYKTKVRRLYDIANILSALKIIEKTHVGDKGKPGFRWLGPEGLQSIRPLPTTAHLAAAPTAFHMPGGFQAALAGDLPPLNMTSAMAAAGAMQEGAAPGGEAGGVQVSLPAPVSLYVGNTDPSVAMNMATGSGGAGGIKRPRRKSLRAREAEVDTEEEDEEEYEEGSPSKKEGGKRVKVEVPPDQAAQQQQAAAAAVQQHPGAPAGVAMFGELPIVMPTADAAAAAAMAAAMASGYTAVAADMSHAGGAPKPKVHPLLKFMELESQTDQSPGMRRVMGSDLVRADGHAEGQLAEGTQTAWPTATTGWGGMAGMEWLTNPAMAASMYGASFWPAASYANMATTSRPKPMGGPGEGQPGGAGEGVEGGAGPGGEGQAEQAQQDAQVAAAAAAAGSFPQVAAFNYSMQKPEGAQGPGPAEGQMVVGPHDGAPAAAPADQGQIASGQPVDAQTAAAQAAAAAGNPAMAWQYWQYMYTNLYANAANATAAVTAANPTVYSNLAYAPQTWGKKHEPEGAEGGQGMVGAGGPAGDAAGAPGGEAGLPVGAYPVVADMSGYATLGDAQHMQHQAAEAAAQQQQAIMNVAPTQQEGTPVQGDVVQE